MLNVRHFQLINLAVILLFGAFYFSWGLLALSLLLYFLFLCIGTTIGLHRGFSHGQLSPQSFWGQVCLFFSVLACMGKPTDWILVHRLHHLYSDEDLDPHSPAKIGRWRVFTNNWTLSKNIPLKTLMSIKRSLHKEKAFKFYDKNYWWILLGYIVALVLIGGPGLVIYGWCLPASLTLLASSLVNAFCHTADGKARDIRWISLVTFGEGCHAFHHAHPNAIKVTPRFSFDVAGWILAAFLKKDLNYERP